MRMLTAFAALAACLLAAPLDAADGLPRIVSRDGRHALIVDGAPFLVLGAQANNSSNYPAMLPKVWPVIKALDANTLVMPIAWEQVEPIEDRFDFSFVDTLLEQARSNDVRLILLWFGTWKNTGPAYAPAWVKLDNKRFPRMKNAKGETHYALSPHFPATLAADRKAFVALMRHLRRADPQNTVIMVQVQNEPGTYGSARDFGPEAQKLFDGPVPAAIVRKLGKRPGSWSQVFGKDADLQFHAWAVASYIDEIARAGKAVKPLPMYVNAALPGDPDKWQDPSTYASGGPAHTVLDMYEAAAPAIDVAGPDIYNSDYRIYTRYLALYARPDNPLFVTETGNRPEYSRYFFATIGHGAIGFMPFGMDLTGYSNFPLGAPRLDPETIDIFGRNFRLFRPMERVWAKLAFEGKVWGVAEPTATHAQTLDLGRWRATISYGRPQFGTDAAKGNEKPSGGVAIAELGPDEYLVTGYHARVEFALARPQSGELSLFDRVEEGHFENGRWVFDRVWNGDQTDWGLNFTSVPQVLKVRLASVR